MEHPDQEEHVPQFFDDTVIALRYLGHYYGVLSEHQNCASLVRSGGGVTTVLASDRDAPRLAERCCDACGCTLLNESERRALGRLWDELASQQPRVPEYIFQWSDEHRQYEAKLGGEILAVSFGLMAHTIYKCVHADLDVKMAFDAREWESGPGGMPRFIVLKKRKASPQVQGWMMWKDGRPYDQGIYETKRSLLIGYDMLPLRGLDRTEEVLRAKGIVARRTAIGVCSEEERDCYAATVNGHFDIAALEYSICHQDKDQTLTSLAGYYGRNRIGHTCDRLGVLSEEEGEACEHYWWFMLGGLYKDGRRRSTFAKLKLAVTEIFARHQICIVPIKYLCLEDASHELCAQA